MIAPHILVKWLPDDITWWKEKTLEVADQSFYIDLLHAIPAPTVQDFANITQLASALLH